MTSPLTIAFSGKSSILQCNFLPEITLDEECEYSCALLDLIIKSNDKFDVKDLVKLEVVRVHCDIISESYINGVQNQLIHQFATRASIVKGQTFVEIPKHLNYFQIKTKNLRSIQIYIVDHTGKPLHIDGGDVSCRIIIRKEQLKNQS